MRWKEPAAFRRAQTRAAGSRHGWQRPLFMLGIGLLGFGGLAWHRNPIAGNWPLSIGVVTAVAWMVAYGVPLIARLDPNIVFIGERGIGRQSNMGGAVRLQC